MRYLAMLGLIFCLVGCQKLHNASVAFKYGTPKDVCIHDMQPALCTVIVGCGHMSNMQECEMTTRSMCLNPMATATVEQTLACSDTLRQMSCGDSFSQECRDLN